MIRKSKAKGFEKEALHFANKPNRYLSFTRVVCVL